MCQDDASRCCGEASRRCTGPGSPEQRRLQGHGTQDAGRKGKGGTGLGRLGQRQGLAETLYCLAVKGLARVLGRWMVNIVPTLIPHPAATGVTAPLQHAGSPARRASRHGGHHTDTPTIQQISSTTEPGIPTATEGSEWGPTPSGSRPESERCCQ